ncbi:MAG: hypothetical protein IT384_29850 [Deltaproteobacteria bacterium]|nr:hypothetical protein [Deltaproteobacteria bacterium]
MRPLFRLLPLALAAACGTEDDPPLTEQVKELAEIPTPAVFAQSERLSAEGPIQALGTSGAGRVLIITHGELQEVVAEALIPRTLYATGADPTSTGEPHHITPRVSGGAWIAASAGLFMLADLYLTSVPLELSSNVVRDVREVERGPLAGLWIATEAGLIHRQPSGGFERLEAPELAGASSQLAVDTRGEAALVRFESRVVMLAGTAARLTTRELVLDTGAITGIGAGSGVLYAATERGLYRWRAGAEPEWSRFTFAADGTPPLPLSALAVDRATGSAWVRAQSAVIRVALDNSTLAFPAVDLSTSERMTVDGLGDLWIASGDALRRHSLGATGAAATFEQDVKPWIDRHCAACHRNQTADFEQYEVFVERADLALSRVRAGDMPRCEGAQVCSEDRRLEPQDYAVLESWIRAGKPR